MQDDRQQRAVDARDDINAADDNTTRERSAVAVACRVPATQQLLAACGVRALLVSGDAWAERAEAALREERDLQAEDRAWRARRRRAAR